MVDSNYLDSEDVRKKRMCAAKYFNSFLKREQFVDAHKLDYLNEFVESENQLAYYESLISVEHAGDLKVEPMLTRFILWMINDEPKINKYRTADGHLSNLKNKLSVDMTQEQFKTLFGPEVLYALNVLYCS